jgi:hypothetical protein
MRLALLSVIGFALVGSARAGTIVVPTDQPHLSAAIAAAAPGDTIRIQTSLDQGGSSLGIVIDKPLTIVGEPVCNIDIPPFGQTLVLNGPGSGDVFLLGLKINYSHTDSDGAATLSGGGFDSVWLEGCTIEHNNTQPSGLITQSFPAIDLGSVKRLTVINSQLVGGPAGIDACGPASFFIDGEAGIRAPSTSVLLIDSTVRGGSGGSLTETTYEACPASLSSWGGRGGDGVVAGDVHSWNSTVSGGIGVKWERYVSQICGLGSTVGCGTQPAGQAFVVTGNLVQTSCSRLTQASGAIPLGGIWSLSWDAVASSCAPAIVTPGVVGFLFVSPQTPGDAVALGGDWVFLDPSIATLAGAFPSSVSQSYSFPVPLSPSLLGLPISAQVLLADGQLSGPTSGLLVP